MDIPYSVLAEELEDGTSIIRVPIIKGYPKLDRHDNVVFHVGDDPVLFSYHLLDTSAPPLRHMGSRRSLGGITKQYLKVGQSAKNCLFGIPNRRSTGDEQDEDLLQPSHSPLNRLSRAKVILMFIGAFLILLGTILSSVPLVEFIISKNLRLLNGSIAHQYWTRPGINRLTKVYIFNVTNPDDIVYRKAKPILQEVGPFVYSEDMQKVNVKFHDNGTVSYQHHKILQFRPELSVDQNTKLVLPNIPVLTAASITTSLTFLAQIALSNALKLLISNNQPFTSMTAKQLLFGYNDPLVMAAHYVFPKHLRPQVNMGLLLGRNGTLDEVHTINSGRDDMTKFGLIERLNGRDTLPMWKEPPCNSISASEGSFFPPRAYTGSDRMTVYDKDLCRVMPLVRKGSETVSGIPVDLYLTDENYYNPEAKENTCFCSEGSKGLECPVKGLQDITPCQYGSPIYMSNPHFLDADPSLQEAVIGMKPNRSIHETFFKINPKLGVPVQAKVRVQVNFKPKRAPYIPLTRNFPEIAFPIMWLEEGVEELTPSLKRWIFLANIADLLVDIIAYGSLALGFCILVGVSTYSYRKDAFIKKTIEKVPKAIRRGSSFIINGNHRLLIIRDSYTRLNTNPDIESDPERNSS